MRYLEELLVHWRGLSFGQRSGLVLLLGLILFAVLEGLLHQRDPTLQDLDNVFAPPGLAEPLGTDQFGRSMLARMGAAVRLSMLLSLVCVMTSACLGVALGVLAGWRQQQTDRVINFSSIWSWLCPG